LKGRGGNKTSSAAAPPKSSSPTSTTSAAGKKTTSNVETTSGEEEEKTYWLLKAEPETRYENGVDVRFSIDDLAAKKEPEPWDGIRNYVARNNLRAMKRGDLAFFYHSNCKEPGIVGVMEIVREHTPDCESLITYPFALTLSYGSASTTNLPPTETHSHFTMGPFMLEA